MRIRTTLATLGCLAVAATAEAGTTWLGAEIHFPVPARDVGNAPLGVGAGVTLTRMHNATIGIGADLIYRYWPASEGYRSAFDTYLQGSRFESLAGSEWAFSTLQVTGHVKFQVPTGGHLTPWTQIGVGRYRMDLNIDEQRPADTYAWVVGEGLGNTWVIAGGYAGIGLDVHPQPSMAVGVDATFHYLHSGRKSLMWAGLKDMPDFSAFTLGAHVLVGWR